MRGRSQKKINESREQKPERRYVAALISKKSLSLLRDCDEKTREILEDVFDQSLILTRPSAATGIPSNTVNLVITSPPFLEVVDSAKDNWLRCWFCDIDPEGIPFTHTGKLDEWKAEMTKTFFELERVLVPGGHVAFEVGEVRNGKLRLEEEVLPCGVAAGLVPELVLINQQDFTKTSHCWGVGNSKKGTNSNRVVLFKKKGKPILF